MMHEESRALLPAARPQQPEASFSTSMPPTRLSAQVHTIQTTWRVSNTADVVVGPEPTLVLAFRAMRDAELRHCLVQFPAFLHGEGEAESLLAEVPRVWGQRVLRAEGDWRIAVGTENVAAKAMLWGANPEELSGPLSEIRWHGGLVQVLEHNVCRHPFDFWCFAGRVAVPRGKLMGVIVRSQTPTICRVKLSGV